MHEDLLIGIIFVASVLLLSALLGAWARKPRRHSRSKKRKATTTRQLNPYAAVSCEGDCDALRFVRGRRFLVKDAPRLPVEGCHAAQCHCRYVHHKDRRIGDDRRGAHGLRTALGEYTGDKERRRDLRHGRRRDDLAYG